jgi:4-hydroxy-tetrahydrodipicolinate reductase
MKIALIGYGKMGKVIEELALKRGHSICAKFSSSHSLDEFQDKLQEADVAIEFSQPTLALEHIDICIAQNCPVVVGTTGWTDSIEKVTKQVTAASGSLLHASNFSIGVNMFFELNAKLAQMMAQHGLGYDAHMEEIHHTQKLDSPSGTAISLANQITTEGKYSSFHTVDTNEPVAENLKPLGDSMAIIAKRIPDVSGTHIVNYSSNIDEIEIKHRAKNRNGFALGSIVAAEWLIDKKGLFTMKDVLKF